MQRNAEAKINLLDMKKILFTGILSILFVGISFAQSPRIGITAGLNTSNVTTNADGANYKYKAGFQAGVVADFAITEKFSIIPELLYAQRGFKMDVSDNEVSGTGSMTLNYLQLPINAAYKFDVGMGSKFLIFAGPYFGYGLSTSAKAESGGSSVSSTDAVKFGSGADQIKALDFGLNVGIGYQYEKIFFKLQYNKGLANMSNTADVSVKNSNIGVSVGYFFN